MQVYVAYIFAIFVVDLFAVLGSILGPRHGMHRSPVIWYLISCLSKLDFVILFSLLSFVIGDSITIYLNFLRL